MSTFSKGDKVRCIETSTTHFIDSGHEYVVEDVRPDNLTDTMEALVRDEWVPFSYFEKVEPEFVVGQQVSGDDYERLPAGTKIQSAAARDAYFTKVAASNAWTYTDGMGNTDSPAALDEAGPARTLTHLPDAPEPEDTDDVESEPLKEDQHVLVWARVLDAKPDGDGEVEVSLHRADGYQTSYATTYTLPDAIVRPDAGQVPPWVKPRRTEAEVLAEVMGCDNHGVTYGVCAACLEMAERVIDAGYRRAEVSS